jgi:apolipoprotein N-acyltransferase
MEEDTKQKKPSGALWLLVPIAGIALELGFENIPLSRFAFLLSGIPLLAFLYVCKNKIHAFFGGWLAGIVFFALNLRWYLTVYPLGWAGIENNYEALAIIGATWLLSSAAFGLGIALFSLLFKSLKTNSWHDVFLAPLFWILCEYIRPYFYEGLWWSPDALWGPHWTNGSLGLLLLDTPLKNIAKVAGIYGLGFCVSFINITTIFLFAGKRIAVYEERRTQTYDIYSKILSLVIIGFFIFSPYTIGKIYANRPSDGTEWYISALQAGDKETSFYNLSLSELVLADQKLREYPDTTHIVVLPEDSQMLVYRGPEEDKIFKDIFGDTNTEGYLIASGHKDGKTVTFYKNKEGKDLSEQAKYMLTPGGEYVPAIVSWIMERTEKGYLEDFTRIRKIARAEKPEEVFTQGPVSLGTLQCSGILSSDLYRRLANQGAALLINQASYGLFKQDTLTLTHSTAMARMQALANDRYLVQSTSSGRSFIVDPAGNIITEGELGKTQFIHAPVRPMSRNTLFVHYGNWIVRLALVVLLIRVVVFVIVRVRLFLKKRTEKKKESVLLHT